MRISDWSSDVCSSDLPPVVPDSTLNAEETYYSESSFALFGQIGYDLGSLIDGLTFNAGLRYSWDDFTGCSTTGPYRAPRIGYDGCRAGTDVVGKVKANTPPGTLGLDSQMKPDRTGVGEERNSTVRVD